MASFVERASRSSVFISVSCVRPVMAEELGDGERKLEGGNIATVTKSLLFTRHIKHLKKMRVQP
jgi:hypothetical protein